MMALHADQNLYPGINIHLNSLLQDEPGGWRSFHSQHVTDLARTIDEALPQGYFTRSEMSLQIGEFDPGSGDQGQSSTIPDVSIYRRRGQSPGSVMTLAESEAPAVSIPIPETLESEDTLIGLVIYQAGEGSLLGRPVTRIELLSPSNKPGGSHYGQYRVKRLDTLKSGLRLVEIDYLHETPPIIRNLPDYSKQEQGAVPFVILVSDPRPTLEQGKTTVFAFGVDDPLPVIDVPLAGADVVRVNFGAAYRQTFEGARFFRMIVDYAQEPLHLERYAEADRQRIQARLAEIRQDLDGAHK